MIVLILFVRWVLVEPFKIPSGSMIPTLLIGDHIFVAKSSYDIRLPFTNWSLLRVSNPKRGDVVVFDYPNYEKDPEKDGIFYIKRIVGIPGDKIAVRGGEPQIENASIQTTALPNGTTDSQTPGYAANSNRILVFQESLEGSLSKFHWAQRSLSAMNVRAQETEYILMRSGKDCVDIGSLIHGRSPINSLNEICPFTVPSDQYFVLGDNRDSSQDSRAWGFVDRSQLKGRAMFIWLSRNQSDETRDESLADYQARESSLWSKVTSFFRWSRFGLPIK